MAEPEVTPGSPFAGSGFDREGWLASPSRSLTLKSWDERAPAHLRSPDYGVDRLVADPAELSGVVKFDIPLLGDITGKRGVHLQCHIGTDTISLARLGAQMAGLDYSLAAITAARELAERCRIAVPFHHADVYDAPDILGEQEWDLVFTGIGALCWLPDIDRWAQVVARLLRPGGQLFLREGHPMLWSLADAGPNGELLVEHAYFERPEPTVWDEPGTYVTTEEQFEHNVTHEWNHGIGETVTALLRHGFAVTGLVEHDSVPWDALPGWMVLGDDGEYPPRRPAVAPASELYAASSEALTRRLACGACASSSPGACGTGAAMANRDDGVDGRRQSCGALSCVPSRSPSPAIRRWMFSMVTSVLRCPVARRCSGVGHAGPRALLGTRA